jgi:DNA-damage-inducible protein D
MAVEHHFAQTSIMMEVGKGARRQGDDYFLSRGACYLVAMNGEPSKPEIAAAQAYFAIQTRRMENADHLAADRQRLDMRERSRGRLRKSAAWRRAPVSCVRVFSMMPATEVSTACLYET